MEDDQSPPTCPNCGSADSPRLIVRPETTVPNVFLRCRACRHEWSSTVPERAVYSDER
jgi:formate dehydrogenase maturation protein FdhE